MNIKKININFKLIAFAIVFIVWTVAISKVCYFMGCRNTYKEIDEHRMTLVERGKDKTIYSWIVVYKIEYDNGRKVEYNYAK